MKTSSPTRWWDAPNALFLVLALLMVSARITSTEWTDYLGTTGFMVILAAASGFALGQSRFAPPTTFLISLMYGLPAIGWRLGTLVAQPPLEWRERMWIVGERLGVSIWQVTHRQDVTDPLLFLTAIFLLFWLFSAYAAYTLVRYGDGWMSVLPPGLILFIIHINDRFWPYRAWYLILYLVLALLVAARSHFLQKQQQWRATRARTPAYLGLDLSRAALLAATPLILLAWTAPTFTEILPGAQQAWNRLTAPARESFDNLFASLRVTVTVSGDTYNDSLALGSGNTLSDAIMLQVQAPAVRPAGVRYYWRARVYDVYDGEAWNTSPQNEETISPRVFDQNLRINPARWDATFVFTPTLPLYTLHSPSQPIQINHTGIAELTYNPDNTADIVALRADPPLAANQPYEVRAALTRATLSDLRAAGDDYPQWVSERYLQLPAAITARTRQLAQEITANATTPYDKTAAITNYLRQNIEYSEVIDTPPNNQERVDWLLFDYQRGFCNYYASAQVVLLRSIGIPARLAVGYAQGERVTPARPGIPSGSLPAESENYAYYTVRQRDLHAWVEVYFPGIGWVEFEPTASQDAILRPSGSDLTPPNPVEPDPANLPQLDDATPTPRAPQDAATPANPAEDTAKFDWTPIKPLMALLGITILLWALSTPGQKILLGVLPLNLDLYLRQLGLTPPDALHRWALHVKKGGFTPTPWVVRFEQILLRMGITPPRPLARWSQLAQASPLTHAYLEINHALRRLHQPAQPAETPAERVHRLVKLLPPLQENANRLLHEYHKQTYSPLPADTAWAVRVKNQIRSLTWWAWFNRLISRWQEPPKTTR